MTTAAAKPQPVPDQDSRGYWSATAERKLVVQCCESCGHMQLYPRLYCVSCYASHLALREASGRGEVYAVTVVRRPPTAAFSDDVPYPVALIRLAEGPMVMANVVGCHADEVAIGMAVEVEFTDVRGDVIIPRFRPLSS